MMCFHFENPEYLTGNDRGDLQKPLSLKRRVHEWQLAGANTALALALTVSTNLVGIFTVRNLYANYTVQLLLMFLTV